MSKAATPSWGRYSELRPAALAAIRDSHPIVYLPWGSLEWHGPHLPLGLDGIIAETVAERVARRTGGVLLPTTWWPITALPHHESLSVSSPLIRGLWDEIFGGLAAADWKVVVTISGHYAQGHEVVLMDAAEEAMRQKGLLVLALPPMALVDEDMLDHAALWEASQLLSIRPDLVDLDALGSGPLRPDTSGVLGRDPRDAASASIGQRAIGLAVERIVTAVVELVRDRRPAPLHALYARRRARYRAHFERYVNGSSIEQGGLSWWQEQIKSQES